LDEILLKLKKHLISLLLLSLAFALGCLVAGVIFHRPGSDNFRELDSRYNIEHTRATEVITRLEDELVRERELNRRLREHNNRARELTEGLADASERNVRNLQDAISLIGEIREKLKVLADFYDNSNSGHSSD
jgi:hypothetical protein